MANITLNYRGLTGKRGTITAADTATFVSLITLIIADEDPTLGVLTNNDYDIALERDTSITDVANGSDPIAVGVGNLGLVDGDTIICIDDKKNLTSTNTKEVRQDRKLRIASVKRQATPGGNTDYTFDITELPNPYTGNSVTPNEFNGTGGVIQSVSITTPYTRTNGSAWNPAITTVRFSGPGYTYKPYEPTATAVFDGDNHLSGVTITDGGSGWLKQNNDLLADLFIIQDNSTGDPDTREVKVWIDNNITISVSDITFEGLVTGRPWN